MFELKLKHGAVVKLDDADKDWALQYSWCIDGKGYATRNGGMVGGRHRMPLMHREIIAAPKGSVVDHINGDKTDNRRSNLRLCTVQQNHWNRHKPKQPGGSSQYLGVRFKKDHQRNKRWEARIRGLDSKYITLGHFSSEQEAAVAYATAAVQMRGAFTSRHALSRLGGDHL